MKHVVVEVWVGRQMSNLLVELGNMHGKMAKIIYANVHQKSAKICKNKKKKNMHEKPKYATEICRKWPKYAFPPPKKNGQNMHLHMKTCICMFS